MGKKMIFSMVISLMAIMVLLLAGCTQGTPSLTGTWTINSGGTFDTVPPSGNGTFGRDFIITVKQENTTLQGTGKDVSGGRTADVPGGEVVLNGEVKDGSKVTFTVHEDFPVNFPKDGHADLVHEFTGTVSGGKIYGTFQGGFDTFEYKYRINGTFVVSVDSAGSTTTPTITANTTTSTPTLTPSQPINLIGVWSGTQVESQSGHTAHYNLVMNVTRQDMNVTWPGAPQVFGQLTATGQTANDGSYKSSLDFGRVSGSTLTWGWGDKDDSRYHVQVSGDSMTGSGEFTASNGIHSWSINLTRVR